MRPVIPCGNHPDSEGDFKCRYCGKDYCGLCVQKEPGFYRCKETFCLQAYVSEMAGPQRNCPHCGQANPENFTVCGSCNEKIEALPKIEPQSLVTLAKFPSVTDAELARTKLQSQGIESFVADKNVSNIYSGGNIFLGGVRLQVREADASQAVGILAQPVGAPAGACRYCGEVLPESELSPEPGPLHCLKPECVADFQVEMKPPSPKGKWTIGFILTQFFCFVLVEVIPPALYSGAQYKKSLLPDYWVTKTIISLSELVCILLAWYWVKRFQRLGWRESLSFLGFKKPNPQQLLAAVILLVPIFAGEFMAFRGFLKEGIFPELEPHWRGHLFSFLFGAGLFEETLYRGFLFRFFRQGRSFFSAAFLTAGLWSLSHLTHVVPFYGAYYDNAGQLGELMFKVFVDGIVGAYLFEKGGYNIWGWMLVHVGYDCTGLIGAHGGDFYVSTLPKANETTGAWVSVFLTVPIALWLMPSKANGKKEGNPLFQGKEVSRLWEQRAWTMGLLMAATLALFLGPAQEISVRAANMDWQKRLNARPRFAAGYRQWAYDLWNLDKGREAEANCQEALAIEPNNYKTWLLWGKILKDREDYPAAAEKFQKAVELAPRNPALYCLWGYVLEGSYKKGDAAEKYRKVLLMKPEETAFTDFADLRLDKILNPRASISTRY